MSRLDAKGTVNTWRKSNLDEKSRVVCEDCNNGWMSRLEQTIAKPILENMVLYGSPLTLFPSGAQSIARFAFKNAVVADHMNASRPPFYTASDRAAFAAHLDLPRSFYVWLSIYPKHRGLFQSYYSDSPRDDAERFQLHVFSYGVGFLVLQAVSFKWASRNQRRHRATPELAQGPQFKSVSNAIWPSTGFPVSWPPEKDLVAEITQPFEDRWRRVVLSYSPPPSSHELLEIQSV